MVTIIYFYELTQLFKSFTQFYNVNIYIFYLNSSVLICSIFTCQLGIPASVISIKKATLLVPFTEQFTLPEIASGA